MTNLPRDFKTLIDDIRQRIDFVEIISGYVALKPSGRNLKGLCPFHAEKTPSFMVSREKGLWHCYGCGAGGDVFSFVQKIDTLSFMEAAEKLAQRAGVPFEWTGRGKSPSTEMREVLRQINEKARDYYRECLSRTTGAKQYLEKREVAPTIIESFQLGYAPDGWDALTSALVRQGYKPADIIHAGLALAKSDEGAYDRFRHRIIFPICDTDGRIIAFGGRALGNVQPKYLNTPETAVFVKNRTLYALHLAKKAIVDMDYAILVEGYMDVLACHQWGFRNTVATMGTAVSAGHLHVLSRLTRKVVILFDSDSAGMAAALRSIPLFEEAGFNVRVATLTGGKDPDEFLKEHGPEAFKQVLASAKPVVEHRLALAASQYDLSQEDQRHLLLQDAVQILSEIRNPADRQLYAARAAEKCFHPNTRLVQWMEDAIRAELARRIAGARRVGPGGQQHSQASQQTISQQESRLIRSEQGLLRYLLNDTDARGIILSEITPDEFTEPVHRIIAERVSALHTDGQAIDPPSVMDGFDSDVQTLISKLFMEEKDSATPMEYIEAIRWEAMIRRERDLKTAIAKGTITQEEMAEYMQLTEIIHTKRFGKTSIGGQ